MVKEPRPGLVKTRLGRDIGMTVAAHWFRHQSQSLIRRMRDTRWTTIVAVTPNIAGLESRVWPLDLLRFPQGPGNIGTRM
ncbi:MAG: TIGR04282 family arsenosugar biosynthesis glycosyltransferase, partial [Paracoccaceae bacterium]